jgi:hypothetical protein
MNSNSKGHNLACALREVADFSRDDLVQHWQSQYGRLPPKGVKRKLLARAYAHRQQLRSHGALKPTIRKQLLKLVRTGFETPSNSISKPAVSEGNRLVRDWQGKTYVVDVIPEGFRWQDRTYKSLSAIATEITGTRWSGPRFFGL